MYQFQLFCLTAVAQESAKSYSGKTLWKDVLEEQADELGATYRFGLGSVIICIILIFKRNRIIRNSSNSTVADGSTVSIPGKVGIGVPIAIKCLFDKGKPGFGVKGINELLPAVLITELSTFTGKFQKSFLVIRLQLFHKFASEHLSDSFHRKKKPFVA